MARQSDVTILYDSIEHFKYAFDSKTGAYIRTGVLDAEGNDTGEEPFKASFPHLIDVGIMGHCVHGLSGRCAQTGVQCYQNGSNTTERNMSIEDFAWIAEQCSGRTNQFALGGRGDPDQHEEFREILEISRNYGIVPNYTTSGFQLTSEVAKWSRQYCGAVAVSWYRNEYTVLAIQTLLKAGVLTNIHYVLGKNSIDEAIYRLRTNTFPNGIHAVIFLLHKPVGQGRDTNVLQINDPRVSEFFWEIDNGHHPYKVGMDSCSVPGIVNFCNNAVQEAIEPCESGRFSCYIDAQLNMMPCSFDQMRQYSIPLRGRSIEEAWNSNTFEDFRNILKSSCVECQKHEMCFGGCPITPQITLCDRRIDK